MATEQPTTDIGGTDTEWSRPTSFYNRYVKYGIYVVAGGFVLWSVAALLQGMTIGRITAGAGYGAALVQSMAPPDTSQAALDRTQRMMFESIAMAMVATVTGIAVSVPIAFGAAENLVPKPVYALNRGLISVSRAVDGLIVAIIAVKAVGLGPLAGIIAISFKTVGFFSKLLAEDLEDIDMGALEATRATGASGFQAVLYGVVPQVVPRFVGLSVYRWDINIRASTIIGIVGAGGIGTLLMQAFSRYEYDFVATILLAIIAVVLVGEITSAYVRKRVQ
ncbi:phosphonate ABC transporter, permease protein PhnE [Halorubrum sp. DTA46]|uniref:phosphonate ABC transporter, permease protein PhnE n=1 Tax=Halorubrum sp. DTA46 TaxID=3402162 RepID=UPI003AABA05D